MTIQQLFGAGRGDGEKREERKGKKEKKKEIERNGKCKFFLLKFTLDLLVLGRKLSENEFFL